MKNKQQEILDRERRKLYKENLIIRDLELSITSREQQILYLHAKNAVIREVNKELFARLDKEAADAKAAKDARAESVAAEKLALDTPKERTVTL